MYSALLSVLMLGMWPSATATDSAPPLAHLLVSPPAEQVHITQRLSASGALIIDRESAQVAYAKQADVQRSMASLTKLMTALVIVENHDLDEVVTIPSSVSEVVGNKAYLPPGEDFTVGDLLSALLIPSGNDAAFVLALYHSGSIDGFVEEMNQRAVALGLEGTSYANPSGLDALNQHSTPRDIALLTSYALRFEAIRSRLSQPWARIYSRSGEEVALNHTHVLLHDTDSPVIAGKTGTTDDAGQCLMSLVEIGGREYIVVLLHSDNRYGDMRAVLSAMASSLVLRS